MTERTTAWVNVAAIERNVARLISALTPGSSLCAVVKADGYGHGAAPVARAAQAGGAARVAVVTADEARRLRGAGVTGDLLVLGPVRGDERTWALDADADVVVTRADEIDGLIALGRPARVHVKLDSGMGRLGEPDPDVARALCERIASADGLRLAGVMTHFATADEDDDRWLRVQLERFTAFADAVRADHPGVIAHAAGDEWVLNGRKWFITGAIGAEIAIVVAKTGGLDDPDPDRRGSHRDYSLILVPTDTPGWEVVRDPGLIGAHMVGGHPEIRLTDVRVPAENLLGQEGEGFVIAQKRLAGGRLAHAMRWIGVSQRALDLTAQRLEEREAFGVPLSKHQSMQWFLADSAIDLYASRMMVLNAAWKVEHGIEHRQEVAMVKTFVAEAFGRILDRCVQVFGSHGMATDLPIGQWYADARAARIYDGASEVHRMTIARTLLRATRNGQSTAEGCGAIW